MTYTTKTTDAIAILIEFVELQNDLIAAFRQKFPQITDWENLLDCPRNGSFSAQGEEWKFQRHGVGVCFTGQKSGKIVDAHVVISEPKAFDEWRLYQYFESIGIEKIDYLLESFDVCNEDGTDKLINNLLKDGAIALAHRRLYTLGKNDRTITLG